MAQMWIETTDSRLEMSWAHFVQLSVQVPGIEQCLPHLKSSGNRLDSSCLVAKDPPGELIRGFGSLYSLRLLTGSQGLRCSCCLGFLQLVFLPARPFPSLSCLHQCPGHEQG